MLPFFLIVSAFILIVVALIHNVACAALSATISRKRISRVMYKLSALAGTPIHEISHAVACILFGHKITSIKLLDLSFNSDTLGYVKHSWNSRSVYQSIGCFFIAIAPLISACTLVYFIYVLPKHSLEFMALSQAAEPSQLLGGLLMQSIHWIGHWLMESTQDPLSAGKLFLVSLVCFHCIPSNTDFYNAGKGSLIVFVFTLAVFGAGVALQKTGLVMLPSPDYLQGLLNAMILTTSVLWLAQLFWIGLYIVANVLP